MVNSFSMPTGVFLVVLAASLLGLGTVAHRNAPTEKSMPLHGTVSGGKLFGFFEVPNKDPKIYSGEFDLCCIPIADPAKKNWKHYFIDPEIERRFRHGIASDLIWVLSGNSALLVMRPTELPLFDMENPDRQKQYREKYPGGFLPRPASTHHSFTLGTLIRRTLTNASVEVDRNLIAGFGAVPTSATSCKSYVLRADSKVIRTWDSAFTWNGKETRWEAKPSAAFAKMDQWIKDLDSANFQKRVTATVELEKIGYLAQDALKKFIAAKPGVEGKRRAEELIEKTFNSPYMGEADYNCEEFPSLFTEDFHFFLRKDDYYFVTESGKLYLAQPPAKGEKARKMKALWTDAKRPIVAVIEDADNDKVWLFAKDKSAGAKMDLYFEMNDTIKTTAFDPSKLRPVDVPGRAKILLEYLPLISNGEKK